MKDWKEKLLKEILTDYNMDSYRAHTRTNTINFIEQLISERDKEWEKWKVLAEAMDKASVGHRVIIKHLLGEDEWTLTRRNK